MQRRAAARQNKLRQTPLRATEKRRRRFVRDIAISIDARRKRLRKRIAPRTTLARHFCRAEKGLPSISHDIFRQTRAKCGLNAGWRRKRPLTCVFYPSRLNAKEAACPAFVAQVKAPLALRRTLCLAKKQASACIGQILTLCRLRS